MWSAPRRRSRASARRRGSGDGVVGGAGRCGGAGPGTGGSDSGARRRDARSCRPRNVDLARGRGAGPLQPAFRYGGVSFRAGDTPGHRDGSRAGPRDGGCLRPDGGPPGGALGFRSPGLRQSAQRGGAGGGAPPRWMATPFVSRGRASRTARAGRAARPLGHRQGVCGRRHRRGVGAGSTHRGPGGGGWRGARPRREARRRTLAGGNRRPRRSRIPAFGGRAPDRGSAGDQRRLPQRAGDRGAASNPRGGSAQRAARGAEGGLRQRHRAHLHGSRRGRNGADGARARGGPGLGGGSSLARDSA